jgi:tetratricopeptide (TPR) repeat protein
MLQAQQATLSFSLSETADNAERVLELLEGASISALSKPHLFLGRTYLTRTDLRLKELGERLDPLAESSQDPYLRAAWFVQRGNCELMLGNLGAARGWYLRGWEGLDRAVREGLRPEPPDSRVFALNGLALLEALRCRAEMHVYIERALSAAREAGDPGSRIFALEYAALTFLSTRDAERALPLLEEGELLARSYQMEVWVNQAALFRACADAQTGDADRSAAELPRILAAGRAMHFNLFDGFGLSHLALAEERRGNWAAAREAVERGLQLASTTLDRLWIAELRRQHAVQRARAGEADAQVAAEYERAIQLAQGQDALTLELRARISAMAWYPEPAARARARAELAALVERPGLDPSSRDLREARALVASDDRREGDPAG